MEVNSIKGAHLALAVFLVTILTSSTLLITIANAQQDSSKEIKISTYGPILSLDPYESYYPADLEVYCNLYDQLVMYEPFTINLTPGLASGWQLSENGTVLIFNIRRNVTFHNGDPLTPYDVWWSLERALPPSKRSAEFNSSTQYSWEGIPGVTSGLFSLYSVIKSIKLMDIGFNDSLSYTGEKAVQGDGWNECVVEFEFPFAPAVDLFAFPGLSIVSYNVAESLGPEQMRTSPVGAGTGPFKFSEYTAAQLELVKNSEYWGEKPKVDKLIWLFTIDPSEALLSLINNEVQIIIPQPVEIESIQDDSNLVAKIYSGLSTRYIGFNCQQNVTTSRAGGALSDVIVRKALSYAIPYDDILNSETLFNGMAERLIGPLPPVLPEYDENINSTGYAPYYDINKANEILDNAGITDVDGDSIRDYKGLADDPSDDMVFYFGYISGSTLAENLYNILKNEFAKLNISLAPLPRSVGEYYSLLFDGQVDIFYYGWGADYVDPDTFLYGPFYSENIPPDGYNLFFYNNSQVDSLIESARITLNETLRNQEYEEVQQLLLEDYPCVWLAAPSVIYGFRAEISGFEGNPRYLLDHLEYADIEAQQPLTIGLEITVALIAAIAAIVVAGIVAYYRSGKT
ncbi:MAG: ABC transporter substrate-binding protein [Candidatus Odinarchaeia archaeon]